MRSKTTHQLEVIAACHFPVYRHLVVRQKFMSEQTFSVALCESRYCLFAEHWSFNSIQLFIRAILCKCIAYSFVSTIDSHFSVLKTCDVLDQRRWCYLFRKYYRKLRRRVMLTWDTLRWCVDADRWPKCFSPLTSSPLYVPPTLDLWRRTTASPAWHKMHSTSHLAEQDTTTSFN